MRGSSDEGRELGLTSKQNMATFVKCICGRCNIAHADSEPDWPRPCVGHCVLSFQVSRCRKNTPVEWNDDQLDLVLGCHRHASCGAREYLKDGAIDPDYKSWSPGCKDSHCIQNVYRIWPHAEVSIRFLTGLSGTSGTTGCTDTIDTRLNCMTKDLAIWFISKRNSLEMKIGMDGRHAKCHYTLRVLRVNGDYAQPRQIRRVQFASMALDLFKYITMIPYQETRCQVRAEFQLVWVPTATCEICGTADEGDFIPFHNCRCCGQRPTFHHGRCCPQKAYNRQRRQRRQRYCDIRNPYFALNLLEFTLTAKAYRDLIKGHLKDDGLSRLTDVL